MVKRQAAKPNAFPLTSISSLLVLRFRNAYFDDETSLTLS